jgi:PAS domain S-box-containing protein
MSSAKGKKILLVEDEAIIAMDERATLEGYGYEVAVASSGEVAIAMVEGDGSIDLVLMDVDLGKGIDGSTAARRILERRPLPVVFLSSHTEPEVVETTEKIASYGYVLKHSGLAVLDISVKMAFRLFEATRRLEEEKEHLRTTLYSIGDAVIVTGIDGRIARMNPVAERLTGWDFLEAEGKPIGEVFALVDSETGERAGDPVGAVLESGLGQGFASHRSLLSRHGEEYQVADSCSPIMSRGSMTGAVLVFRDVSEAYEVQRSLEASRERLEIALEVSNAGIWEWDIAAGTVRFDARFHALLGYEEGELPSRTDEWATYHHPEDWPSVMRRCEAYLRGETPVYESEHRIRAKSGEWAWVFTRGKRAPSTDHGNEDRFMGIAIDVSERKATEEKVRMLLVEKESARPASG